MNSDNGDGLRTSVTEINDLPNEILVSILSYFYTQTLESTIGQVCIRWKDLAEEIIRQRLTAASRRFPETMIELRTQFSGNDADLKALKEWERIYVGPDFFLLRNTYEDEVKAVAELDTCAFAAEFLNTLLPEEDEDDELDEEQRIHPFDKTLKFIPCHQLLVIVKDHKCIFYHESVISTAQPYQEYTVEVDCLDLPDGTLQRVSFLDVYQDKLAVVLKITRHAMLYRLTEVCHENRKVTLKPLRNIFFPDWVQAITLFKDKVYVLYTTWYFAVWHLDNGSGEAEILTSQQKIAPNSILKQINVTDYTLMCRLNNLLFVRLSYTLRRNDDDDADDDDDDEDDDGANQRRRKWFILDMNEENSVELTEIPMEVIEFEPNNRGLSLIKIYGNILLLLMRSGLPSPFDDFWAVKLRKEPRKEDFLDGTKFSQLIDDVAHLSTSLNEGHIVSLPPSLSVSISTKHTFLGIRTSDYPSPAIEILSIDSRHGLYIA